MGDDTSIVRQMRDRQLRLGRILERNGVTIKALAFDSGIPESTLRSYLSADKGAVHQMPLTALCLLIGCIPDEWLSTLIEPEGRALALTGARDPDDLAGAAIEYASAHAQARHPQSPGGVAITEEEGAGLALKAVNLRGCE